MFRLPREHAHQRPPGSARGGRRGQRGLRGRVGELAAGRRSGRRLRPALRRRRHPGRVGVPGQQLYHQRPAVSGRGLGRQRRVRGRLVQQQPGRIWHGSLRAALRLLRFAAGLGIPGEHADTASPVPSGGRCPSGGVRRGLGRRPARRKRFRRLRPEVRRRRSPSRTRVPGEYVHDRAPAPAGGGLARQRGFRRGLGERESGRKPDGRLRPAVRGERRPRGGRVRGQHLHPLRPAERRRRLRP